MSFSQPKSSGDLKRAYIEAARSRVIGAPLEDSPSWLARVLKVLAIALLFLCMVGGCYGSLIMFFVHEWMLGAGGLAIAAAAFFSGVIWPWKTW